MRYLKLASDKNPTTDFIELNDFYGFLCTGFQSTGISRELEFLPINNVRFVVGNKLNFKKYSLTIEILTKYSEYEAKHKDLISFLDRNKKNGFRLYYRPYDNMELKYCLCSIETSVKTEKMQPVVLTLTQNSLWFGEQKTSKTVYNNEDLNDNVFAFKDDNGYYSASFSVDKNIGNYYCIEFFNSVSTKATIVNNSYNEIPLNIRIYGECVNPTVSLFVKNEEKPIRELQIFANISKGDYIEINSTIINNGILYIDNNTKNKYDYSSKVNNDKGSPYFYIENGEYYIVVKDDANNAFLTEVVYQEEYSE